MPVPAEPFYRRIVDDIIAKIKSGEWPVGHIVPPPAELAEYYSVMFGESVSEGTVRNSRELLKDRGILAGRQGKNTIVARIPD